MAVSAALIPQIDDSGDSDDLGIGRGPQQARRIACRFTISQVFVCAVQFGQTREILATVAAEASKM